ncbi:MAG: tRNA dihydrouridine synthase DusB [Planctomycetaceae bacterium]|nr:tRNA dihydrouridine synthase DusB [Planctomycetaceae bacterium]
MTTKRTYPKPEAKAPIYYGPLKLESRYLLSPLAGFTNLSFRRIVRQFGGVGLATTDLVNSRGLLAGSHRTMKLIETCPEDSPFAVQIFGNDTVMMRDAAQLLEARGVHSIDINMGCPVDRITNNGGGASMMCRRDWTLDMVQGVVEAVSIPITVKMRLGWDSTQITAPLFAREFEKIGVVAVAIHGRTREQGFTGNVDHDGIRQVVEAVDEIPVVGNGDIKTVADADYMMKVTGCQVISIGRGALANPWIFRQLVQWEETGEYDPPGNFVERLELLRRQFGYMEEQHGTKNAIITFRKMGHWYLKSMRVRAALRHQFQLARTIDEFEAALAEIAEEGPTRGTKTGELPEWHIPVPSGPVERW